MIRLYLDANVFIYFFDQHPVFGVQATRFFRLIRTPGFQLMTSIFCLAEVLVGPQMRGEEFKSAQVRRFFATPAMSPVSFTPAAMDRFVQLRAEHRIKPMDALHLACAAEAGVDLFITNDERLQRLTVPGIGRIAGLDYEL